MTAFIIDRRTAVPKATCCRLDHESGKVVNCAGENRGRAYIMEAVINGIQQPLYAIAENTLQHTMAHVG